MEATSVPEAHLNGTAEYRYDGSENSTPSTTAWHIAAATAECGARASPRAPRPAPHAQLLHPPPLTAHCSQYDEPREHSVHLIFQFLFLLLVLLVIKSRLNDATPK